MKPDLRSALSLDLFPLPEGWSWNWLGDVMDIQGGAQPPASTFKDYAQAGYVRFVQIRDFDTDAHLTFIQDSPKWRKCTKQDVLIARYGVSLGRILRGLDGAYNVALAKAIPGEALSREFLFYLLRSSFFQLAIQGVGSRSVQSGFNKEDLRVIPVPIPTLKEQHVIAHILGTLDELIELNRKMNKSLEAFVRAIFKSWFVKFEPVRAKIEVRDTGLPQHLVDLFPRAFEDSELGKIPKGWKVTVLGEVLDVLETGGRPKGGVAGINTGVPSIGAESIVGLGVFDYSKTKFVPQDYFDDMTRGHVQNRDVLLYKDGGRPGEYEPHITLFGDGFPFRKCAINEHVYRLRAKEEFGQNLLFVWLSSDLVKEEMRTKGTGVAIPGLNSSQVRSLTTLVPTPDIAQAFNALLEPCIAKILSSCNESRRLETLRDTLLPRLISGELRINDVKLNGGISL